MLGLNYVEFAYVPAANTRGGVLVAARGPDVALTDAHIGCYSMTVAVHTNAAQPAAAGNVGSHDATTAPWWLTVVYGPQDEAEKSLFLEELAAIRDQCPGPWVVIVDFNLILDESDKNNSRINRRPMCRFCGALAELELMDIHLHGRRYTWSNEREERWHHWTGKSGSLPAICRPWRLMHPTTVP
jgi:hypothetical protein